MQGCGFYRLVWPAMILKQAGYSVEILPPRKDGQSGFVATTQLNDKGQEVLQSVGVPADADVLVIQRPAHPLQAQMITMLRSNGIAVVVDMDDDMSTIHPDNGAYHIYRHRSASPMSWRYAATSCRVATMVTTSTAQLQKVYAGHGRGRVLDNYVPQQYLSMPKVPTGMYGWAGTTKSHPNDPQVTAPAVDKLIAEGHMFQVIGGDKGVQAAFRTKFPVPMTGSIPLSDFVATIGTSLDVGWAPLAATSFNSSKSRLKPLEYMAAGVAWVGSPRAEYRKLHNESKCGLLADTPKQWYQYTKELLTNDAFREEQIQAGYEYMADQTYEAQAWRWWETWEAASQFERKRVGLE